MFIGILEQHVPLDFIKSGFPLLCYLARQSTGDLTDSPGLYCSCPLAESYREPPNLTYMIVPALLPQHASHAQMVVT